MKPSQNASLAEVKDRIRGVGLRSTAARIAVIQHLESVAIPQSHAEVAAALESFGFDQSTIYRCLTELSDAGLLSRLDLGDSIRRFELLQPGADATIERHPHFMCVDCGSIVCLDDFTFRLAPKQPGVSPPGEIAEVLLKGRCSQCLDTANSRPA
ncbi:transcriptional repressor [bacterium]|nr:transcriptional repressor [bacterium]